MLHACGECFAWMGCVADWRSTSCSATRCPSRPCRIGCTGLFQHGGASVDVFFVLSGLVIVQSLASFEYRPLPFLIARVARIYPVFLVVFTFAVAIQPLATSLEDMAWIGPDSGSRYLWAGGWPPNWGIGIATHLTMTHGIFPDGVLPGAWVAFLGTAWSLSTEWQFYVLALLLGHRLGLVRMTCIVFGARSRVAGLAVPQCRRHGSSAAPSCPTRHSISPLASSARSWFARNRAGCGFTWRYWPACSRCVSAKGGSTSCCRRWSGRRALPHSFGRPHGALDSQKPGRSHSYGGRSGGWPRCCSRRRWSG